MIRSRSSDVGSIGIALSLTVGVTLGGAALVVDGGRAMVARRHAAATAEAAARAAIVAQPLLGSFDEPAARSVALTHAVRAGVPAEDVAVSVRTVAGRKQVYVTVTERRRSVFLILLAVPEMSVTASGAATVMWEP